MEGNANLIIVILLFTGASQICGDGDSKGRLLTPEEGCGLTKVKNSRIIGGSEAPAGAYPWITVLGYMRLGNTIAFECGGSLITSRHVLTAAHCVEDDLHVARVGEHDLQTEDDGIHEDILVARAVKHPNPAIYDIGIVHLERDVKFSDKIRPVCLPFDEPYRSREFADSNAFVAGWGITCDTFNFDHRSDTLLQLQVPIVGNEKCKELLSKIGKAAEAEEDVKEHVICAGGIGGKGFWIGDSGGPLVLPIHQNGTFPFYQIGVVALSFGCARENAPGIYSKVQFHADWIKEQLK